MSDFLYPVQEYFPSQCRECPVYIGFIEDGHLSPKATQEEANQFLQENGRPLSEDCSGVFEEKEIGRVVCVRFIAEALLDDIDK